MRGPAARATPENGRSGPICKTSFAVALIALFGWLPVGLAMAGPQPPSVSESDGSDEVGEASREAGPGDDGVEPDESDVPGGGEGTEGGASLDDWSLPDFGLGGRRVRQIGLYASQLASLVPRDYRPISLGRLREALESRRAAEAAASNSRITAATYRVRLDGDTLISERTTLRFESTSEIPVRVGLGRVNLAVTDAVSSGESFLETDIDGTLSAVVRKSTVDGEGSGDELDAGDSDDAGDSGSPNEVGVEFGWTLRGSGDGSEREFDLRIPKSPRATIELELPEGVELESVDGAIREEAIREGELAEGGDLPGLERPEPAGSRDAGLTAVAGTTGASGAEGDGAAFAANVSAGSPTLVVIDVGGLRRVRLKTRLTESPDGTGTFFVRRATTQYDVDGSGLRWSTRMTVELPGVWKLPDLVIRDGVVTSVTAESLDIPFLATGVDARTRHVHLHPPSELRRVGSERLTLTVSGRGDWDDTSRRFALPACFWEGGHVVQTASTHQVQLRVFYPLTLLDWDHPSGWTRQLDSRVSEGSTTYRAQGPPVEDAKAGGWSRVRIGTIPVVRSSSTMLKLSTEKESLRGVARLAIRYAPQRIEPTRLRIQPGWTVRSITFPRSDRVLESPGVGPDGTVVIWPEAGDMEPDGTLMVEIAGRPQRPGNRLYIEPTWMVRPAGVPGTLVAAVVPPPTLNWYGDAALNAERLRRRDLTESESKFFQDLPAEALLFGRQSTQTPALTLRPPSVAFDVDTRLQLERIDDTVSEVLTVETHRHSATLNELTVVSGPAEGRPEYRWTVVESFSGDRESAPPVSLPSSKVQVRDAAGEGEYTIDLAGQDLRGKRLVGRRRYPLVERFTSRLPRVREASSQNGTAVIGEGLGVERMSPSVTRIPYPESRGDSVTRLRYDAVDQPSISVARRDADPRVTMVWREAIRVSASSGGSDSIEADYSVVSANPIVIEYPGELELFRVVRDGKRVEVPAGSRRPLQLPGGDGMKAESVHVVWNRNDSSATTWRRCVVPEIRIVGAVTHSEYWLAASADTFSPSLLWRDARVEAEKGDSRRSVSVRPGQRAFLLPRNVAVAAGWVVAMLVFAFSWLLARGRPMRVLVGIGVAAAVCLLWASWTVPVVGWGILPAIAGGLVAACTRSRGAGELPDSPSAARNGSRIGRRDGEGSRGPGRTGGGSFPHVTGAGLVAIASTFAVTDSAIAQPFEAPNGTSAKPTRGSDRVRPPIDLLVPVDQDGEPVGDKVYLPGSAYGELFGVPTRDGGEPARFRSAVYRVKLASGRDQAESGTATVEAEYDVSVGRSTTRISLPIDAASVQRVERIGLSIDQIVRFADDGDGGILVSVPPGDRFRFRLTLLPGTTTDKNSLDLRLDIPSIASSRLLVEGDRGIARVQIVDGLGRVTSDPELGRWSADLGPIDRLQLRCRFREVAPARVSDPLQRRFWVHIGKTHTAFDCEVHSSYPVPVGDTIQLVVIDTDVPVIAGSAWRLERTERLSPSRWLVTLSRHSESEGPIRLLWRRPTVINRGEPDEPRPMSIPDVVAPASKPNAPAWVAVDRDPDLTLRWGGDVPIEPLSVDQFLDVWDGYHGPIDQSFVALRDLPSMVVGRRSPAVTTVRQRHHLHVSSTRHEIRFTAVITRPELGLDLRSLHVPDGVDLLSVAVDGEMVAAEPLPTDHGYEWPLGRLPDRDSVTVEAIGVTRPDRDSGGRFGLPRFRIVPHAPTADAYTLTRDRSVRVTEVVPPDAASGTAVEFEGAEALIHGWVPVATWVFDDPGGEPTDGEAGDDGEAGVSSEASENGEPGTEREDQDTEAVLQLARSPIRFGCDQRIALTWDQGRWGMETRIRFAGESIPDFVDIEIPTRWCDSLDVQPATTWARQPATNPGYQVVRIRCDQASLGDGKLTLRGRLEDEGVGRVSVPSVRVLRARTPRIYVTVPSQLTNERVRWRTSGVTRGELPPALARDVVPDSEVDTDTIADTDANPGNRSTYLTSGAHWSIELVSLPRISVDAIATAADYRLYPQHDGTLCLCRWDLVPGGLDSVTVSLPAGAEVLGAWTAGQAVDLMPVAEADSEPVERESSRERVAHEGDLAVGMMRDAATSTRWSVPLSISRLSQPVELLMRVPVAPGSSEKLPALPELLDVPVEQRWLSIHDVRRGGDGADGTAWLPGTETGEAAEEHRRHLTLAESVVSAVERSIDLLAEHPTGEVSAWLEPWAARYLWLARSDGHRVEWGRLVPVSEEDDRGEPVSAESDDGDGDEKTERSASDEDVPTSGPSWDELDRRIGVLVDRFVSEPDQIRATLFDGDHFDRFRATDVIRLGPEVRAVPAVPERPPGWVLHAWIVRVISLAMLVGAAILAWPLRRFIEPSLRHPAAWLAAGIVVAAYLASSDPAVVASLAIGVVALPMVAHRWSRRRVR